jgi:hypothetical protein
MDGEPGLDGEPMRATNERGEVRGRHLRLVHSHGRVIEHEPVALEVKDRRPGAATALAALNVVEGIGGLVGCVMLVSHPNGTAEWPVSWLDRFPFHTFLIPGLVLGTIMGIGPLVVAYGLLRRPVWRWIRPLVGWTRMHWSWVGAVLVATAVILWMVIELTLTPIRSAPLQITIGAIGIAMAALVGLPSVRRWYAEP